ncbi:MAG: hypothetical protein IT186_23635 [Acidobacteria bacterium]|nr:hypothetical protein [Acidobacteriota bacterium]
MFLRKTIPATLFCLAVSAPPLSAAAATAPPPFKKNLQDATGGKIPVESLAVSVTGCRSSLGYRLQVWGDGTGFLNEERQIAVTKAQLKSILKTLSDGKFADLAKDYGAPGSKPAKKDPAGAEPDSKARPAPPRQAALEVLCNVEVSVGGARKMVTQFNKGAIHEPFMKLGRDLFEAVRDSAASAKTVKTLGEGLDAIEKGGLSRRALFLLMNRIIETKTPGSDAAGWLIRIEGDEVSASERTFSKGEGPVYRTKLDAKASAKLLQTVRQSQPDQFPPNLYEETYTDLKVSVLNRSVNVNARQFAGMDAKTHLDKQARFDQLVQAMETLLRTVLKEGKQVPIDTP